jgi:pimeloyl-ACP methyl ester carboxylesterase
MAEIEALSAAVLPVGVRSVFVEGVNGLRVHTLEAGYEGRERPLIVLLHGFPELAYSWRKVMLPLAESGFHVVAPDLRGYGRTTGWDGAYDGALASFGILNMVRDALTLVSALGRRRVAMLVGHDFGSFLAAACALVRPDVFRSVVLMSAPFGGPPPLPLAAADKTVVGTAPGDIEAALARLDPPRKHYHWYYSTRPADADMRHCEQGVHAFLRAYYHHKSADWPGNRPFPLAVWSAEELAKLPTYYVMRRDETMAQTVAHEMPSAERIAACRWLTEDELRVYSGEYERTGFQGGLQTYRCRTSGLLAQELATFSGLTIDVPACFIAGRSDWGVFQKPGDFEAMQSRACSRMERCHLVDGAGHWVQQEQADAVIKLLTEFAGAQEHAA